MVSCMEWGHLRVVQSIELFLIYLVDQARISKLVRKFSKGFVLGLSSLLVGILWHMINV
jgi:hypothetical protein